MTVYYTMIGSRKTPKNIMELMERFAYKACKFNYVGRSGGADGADSCLEQGVANYVEAEYSGAKGASSYYMEIYLPWKNFNGRDSDSAGYFTLTSMINCQEAEKIASKVHPAWDRCKQGAKKLHSRNVYQLLGQDLKTPSRFLVCWAEPRGTGGHVKGGTGTAVSLGISHGVEIINLYNEKDFKRVSDWVNKG